MPTDHITCPDCGTPTSQTGQSFCDSCGAFLRWDRPAPPAPPADPRTVRGAIRLPRAPARKRPGSRPRHERPVPPGPVRRRHSRNAAPPLPLLLPLRLRRPATGAGTRPGRRPAAGRRRADPTAPAPPAPPPRTTAGRRPPAPAQPGQPGPPTVRPPPAPRPRQKRLRNRHPRPPGPRTGRLPHPASRGTGQCAAGPSRRAPAPGPHPAGGPRARARRTLPELRSAQRAAPALLPELRQPPHRHRARKPPKGPTPDSGRGCTATAPAGSPGQWWRP